MSDAVFDFRSIERRWQERWETEGTYRTETYPEGPTYFVLVFPPYPNGRIHMGHVRNYAIGDAVARYQRLCGRSVLHPIGFDAFGLPNEIEAQRQAVSPEALTRANIATMARQLRRLGFAYDWPRAMVSINPAYYRWNQWLFLSLRERGLAYRKEARVQWCPGCRTALANEQVVDGGCWRCGTAIVSRWLEQWFFRLRAYAAELWQETERGAFPPHVGRMLQDWLGRAEGAELRFPVLGAEDETVTVFTTRPELAHGTTYLALSPEHPLAGRLVAGTAAESPLRDLRKRVRSSLDPSAMVDGIDTGWRALHPLTGETIPIWVAAYVDPDFATGAVMGNPCHDTNDHRFARAHGLDGRVVVLPEDGVEDGAAGGPYLGDGVLCGAVAFAGRRASEARHDVIRDWETRGIGVPATIFAIRDWLISRQRAWGAPIPIVHCGGCGEVPVKRRSLPVLLPTNLHAEPAPEARDGNPLARCDEFVSCVCPRCGTAARRETDTMDTFIDTTWYYLRATNPAHEDALCDAEAVRRWGSADLYVGGIEIAVPIMLYGSFVTKALRDAGQVSFALPCRQLLAHEMVLKDGRKMSKSMGNTVDPEELVAEVGADTVRLLILSLAPPGKAIEWSDERLRGCHRFLGRVWALGLRQAARRSVLHDAVGDAARQPVAELERRTRETVAAVTRDMDRLRPNTCITALIKHLYALEEREALGIEGDGILATLHPFHQAVATFVVLLSPFAPHVCAELWERLGMPGRLSETAWPRAAAAAGAETARRIAVKVDARAVARLEVEAGASREEVLALAYADEAVQRSLAGRKVLREVYVPGQVLNVVTSACVA